MSGWFVFAAWLLGVTLTWRTFTMGLLESMERDFSRLDGGDRAMSAMVGTVLALIWPVSLPIRSGFRLLFRQGALTTSKEKAAAEKAELQALRKLAREHNLPMPGGDS